MTLRSIWDFDPQSSGVTYLGDPTGISIYADGRTDAANNYILQLGTLSASLQPPIINPEFPTGPSAPTPLTTTMPALEPVLWVSPDAPGSFVGELDVEGLLPEPFDESPPELLFGTEPLAFSDLAPDAPGINLVFEDPELELNLPAAPDLLALTITPFDGVDMPTIDFTIPTLDVAVPTIREYTPGSQYTSALLTALKTSLQDRIENGGTGLSADVENAIWDRNREREYRAYDDARRELDRMQEELGYSLPSGVWLDTRLKLVTETQYVNVGHSREVMIKQAELEQANVLAALNTATQIEGQLITYTNAVEQRLFESTKYATEAGIAIYNAQVNAYVAYVEAYSKKINIYEALVRGELAKVEAYKAQVEAELAKATINRALVDMYKVQSDVALANVEVFKARIEAIQAKAQIEKLKIETYGEQVRAYAAKIGAYTAGVEAFRAKVQAEGTKQEAYKSRVQAYVAQVDAGARQVEARATVFRGQLEAYTASWDAYKSAYQGEAARASAIASNNTSIAEGFKAEVSAITSYNEVLTKQWQVTLDQAQRVSEIGVAAAKANAEMYITTRSLALDAAKVGAQVSAQLGAAALNAINWSSSISTSESHANSWSTSYGVSDSESTSHNYNYSVSS